MYDPDQYRHWTSEEEDREFNEWMHSLKVFFIAICVISAIIISFRFW